jgi:hypothetical protein
MCFILDCPHLQFTARGKTSQVTYLSLSLTLALYLSLLLCYYLFIYPSIYPSILPSNHLSLSRLQNHSTISWA